MEHADYHLDEMTKQIRQIRHSLVEHLEKKGVKDASRVVVEECFAWARDIQKKYPDSYHAVRSYYGMVGGHSPDTATVKDFKAEDSALLFLANLRKKLLSSK
ncbi:hypothetical protein HY413_02135 [Candidatus Kaiserbacteria bacterium]|nr:hypothetical protein [Candidatus Kaiserbacteria bacterium]